MLVTSIFSFSHNVFKRYLFQSSYKLGLYDIELSHFPNKHWFLRVCNTSLLKTLSEKEKLLITRNFFSYSIFSTHLKNFPPFSSNSNCCLQAFSVWKSLQFVAWERVKLGKGLTLSQTNPGFYVSTVYIF